MYGKIWVSATAKENTTPFRFLHPIIQSSLRFLAENFFAHGRRPPRPHLLRRPSGSGPGRPLQPVFNLATVTGERHCRGLLPVPWGTLPRSQSRLPLPLLA